MAKHCNVCNQDYADNLTICPHCAAAKKTQLARQGEARATHLDGIDEVQIDEPPAPRKLTPSDSEVNLGSEAVEQVQEGSGIDLYEGEGTKPRDKVQIGDSDSPEPRKVTPADSTVNLGSLDEEEVRPVSEVDFSVGEERRPGDSGFESAVNLGSQKEQPFRPVSEAEFSLGDETRPSDSGFGVAKFKEPPPPSASDVALRSLMEETPGGEPAAEEQDVAERQVEDMVSNLEEVHDTSMPEGPAEVAEGEEEIAEPEEPVEAAEEDEAVETAEEEEKPAKAAKPRSNIPALAGTGILGILIGAGGMMLIRPGEKEKQPVPLNMSQGAPQGVPAAIPQAKAAPSFETLAARVAGGDWDEAKTAGIEQIQETNPKELVVRGQYHLGVYLKNAGNKINPKDPALHAALQDLQKAAEQNEPNALYDLALIKELAGQLAEARDQYAQAAQKFANDPVQKQRFESAILRVELKEAAKAIGAIRPPQQSGEDRAALAALLVIALQQPQPPVAGQAGQQPAAAENKEAGFEFWDAVKLAHTGKLAEAVAALDRARKLHDQMRFSRLRKAQNPLSDPAEDIFLRCCDELKTYWQLEKELRDGGYLTEKNTPSQALQALVEKSKGGGGGAPSKELTDKLAAAQKGQKDAETKAAALEKQNETAKSENTKLSGELKAAQKTIEERQADLTSAKQQLEKSKSDSETHSGALKKIREELIAANLLAADDEVNVGEAVRKAIDLAKTKDTQGQPQNAPRLRRPVSVGTRNPLAAEKHFAAGLNFYFDDDFVNAEKSFQLAVENYSLDARYFYFLGLSRLAQDRRRDANADFNQGAMLERRNRPAPAAVNESLERIQGSRRRLVNEFRQSPEQ